MITNLDSKIKKALTAALKNDASGHFHYSNGQPQHQV